MVSSFSNKVSLNEVTGVSHCNLPKITINGKYKIIKKLGSGSFGDVYLARSCSNTQKEVSLFVILNIQSAKYYVTNTFVGNFANKISVIYVLRI